MKAPLAFVLIAALGACTAQQQNNASATANDTYLVTAVGTKIAAVDADALSRVHIASDRATITLSGPAHNQAERRQFVAAAKSVSGVTSVRDQMTIDPHAEGLKGQAADAALTAKISAAIAGQAGVNAFDVHPSVHGGNVTLRGTVKSRPLHETIVQAVRGVSGVKSVIDDLVVESGR